VNTREPVGHISSQKNSIIPDGTSRIVSQISTN